MLHIYSYWNSFSNQIRNRKTLLNSGDVSKVLNSRGKDLVPLPTKCFGSMFCDQLNDGNVKN